MAQHRSLGRRAARTAICTVVAGSAVALWSVPSGGATAEDGVPPAPCLGGEAVLTVEEQRIGLPLVEGGESAAAQFLRAAGFEDAVTGFSSDLCAAQSLVEVEELVARHGEALWELAVARAQGEAQIGTIDRYDDRPLYWARLHMTRALRQWEEPFETTVVQRSALVHILDRSSRGITTVEWPEGPGDARRVMISGFDTYSLDQSLRNSNPSGATALQLDGRTLQTDAGPVVV